jgi:hypothetical protein
MSFFDTPQQNDNINSYYYTVEDFNTYSRNEAMIRSMGNIDKLRFYFLDHIWDNADWSNEPKEDLQLLAHNRCQSIREQHDWLCLWLSAGYDSQTVLQYFIEAGIKIDEIAFRSKSALFDDPEPRYVLETANYYRLHHNSKVKFTLINHEMDSADFYLKHKENWIYHPGAVLRFSKTGMNNYILQNRALKIQSEQNNIRRADITGHEKPRVDLRDGNWYMFMPDGVMANVLGIKTVDFFLPEDQPTFFIKQVYQAIKFFESVDNINHEMVHKIQSSNHIYKEWNLGLGRYPIDCLESSDGRLKSSFINGLEAGDSVRLIKHLVSIKHKSINYWLNGINFLQEKLGAEIDIFSTITSKAWKVCKFGKYL